LQSKNDFEESTLDLQLEARLRFSDLATRFATCADRNEAMKALHLLTKTFRVTAMGGEKPKGMLANFLMMRQVSTYQTRHHVAQPTLTDVRPDSISGVVPITSYKVDDGKMSISVSDFHMTIIPEDGIWKVDRLQMVPFALGESQQMAPFPMAGGR
jgi:hypothetical protein